MQTKLAIFCFSLCCVLISFAVGCSGDAKSGVVTGNVTFDGAPLKLGIIRFDPIDGHAATAEAIITDGKFSAQVPPGEKRVSITSPKVVGKKKMYDTPDSPMIDLTEELLPKHYNANSDLKLTVKLGRQDAAANFDLKSK